MRYSPAVTYSRALGRLRCKVRSQTRSARVPRSALYGVVCKKLTRRHAAARCVCVRGDVQTCRRGANPCSEAGVVRGCVCGNRASRAMSHTSRQIQVQYGTAQNRSSRRDPMQRSRGQRPENERLGGRVLKGAQHPSRAGKYGGGVGVVKCGVWAIRAKQINPPMRSVADAVCAMLVFKTDVLAFIRQRTNQVCVVGCAWGVGVVWGVGCVVVVKCGRSGVREKAIDFCRSARYVR